MKNVYKVLSICLIVAGLVCPGCRPSPTAQLEENKAIARRWVDEANKGSLATVIELLAPDFVYHGTGTGGPGVPRKPMTREELEQGMRNFFAAFPDARLTIEDTIAEGDRVVMRWTFRATHKGDFAGMPATGKELTVTWILILRIADGKIVEMWTEADELGLMQQVGAIPAGV